MDLSTSASILPFLQTQGYFIIFLLMVVEGPIVTSIAAFAASLGYLDIYMILIISLLGNLIPDILLFFIGPRRLAVFRIFDFQKK